MKILCISNYYPPHYEGGYELSVKESMDYLSSRGHSVYVLCGHKGLARPKAAKLDFATNDIQRVLRYISYDNASFINKHHVEVHNYRLCLAALKLLKPDIVYMGSQKAISIAPALAVQRSAIARVYDIGDDWMSVYYPKAIHQRFYRWLKRILPFCIGGQVDLNPVICVSKWLAEELKVKYASKQIHIVPRAVALSSYRSRPTFKAHNFIMAGRIEPQKGLHLLIEAAKNVCVTHPQFKVDIYGDADVDYLKLCRKLIQDYHLEQHFDFKGFSSSMADILPIYDVMLMPTLMREPFGRVIIEAMAAGLIVIASNAYGPAEIIDHGTDSLLFERANPKALAECINTLMDYPDAKLESMRLAAYQKVSTKYELSLVKKRIEEIMEQIVNQSQANVRNK